MSERLNLASSGGKDQEDDEYECQVCNANLFVSLVRIKKMMMVMMMMMSSLQCKPLCFLGGLFDDEDNEDEDDDDGYGKG